MGGSGPMRFAPLTASYLCYGGALRRFLAPVTRSVGPGEPDMAFSEALKLKVKKSAHFSCCLCRAVAVEVHHIIPQEESGPDTIDNAAPLCPTCHELYGANPTKRKFLREARDFWYDICSKRYKSDGDSLGEIRHLLEQSRSDFLGLKSEITGHLASVAHMTNASATGPILKVEAVVAFVFSQKCGVAASHVDILFSDVVWEELGGPDAKKWFLARFGELFAERVCLYSMSEVNIDLSKGFTDAEFAEVLSFLYALVILMRLLDEGKIAARINHEGQLEFHACG